MFWRSKSWREIAKLKGTYVKEGRATRKIPRSAPSRQVKRRAAIVAARHAGGGFHRSQWRDFIAMTEAAANP